MNPVKGLIFDFDGTLADSLGVVFECVNQLADKYGYLPVAGLDSLRSVAFKDFLNNHLRLNPLRLYFWRRNMRKLISEKRHRIKLFDGVDQMLFDLQGRSMPLFLLTSSPPEHSISLLRQNKLEIFSRSYFGVSMLNKARRINTLIRDTGIARSGLCYIGDEIKDAESCKKAGIRMIGVSWGMNDRNALAAAGAFRVVDTPREILTYVSSGS
jgi:phosphoglycolate phosphatase-like HAD superfamily hydrolase